MPCAPTHATHQVATQPQRAVDLSRLTGHQRAALSVGVDIDRVSAADLARMDLPLMKSLAQEQLLAAVQEHRDSQKRAPIVYPYPWGSTPGYGTRK